MGLVLVRGMRAMFLSRIRSCGTSEGQDETESKITQRSEGALRDRPARHCLELINRMEHVSPFASTQLDSSRESQAQTSNPKPYRV